jgi:hypothetical protein
MTDPPRPAPKTPRPIRDDPKVDMLDVVIAFRSAPVPLDAWESLQGAIRVHLGGYRVDSTAVLSEIDVAVRKIGAGGEKSADEGRWDAPNRGSEHAP